MSISSTDTREHSSLAIAHSTQVVRALGQHRPAAALRAAWRTNDQSRVPAGSCSAIPRLYVKENPRVTLTFCVARARHPVLLLASREHRAACSAAAALNSEAAIESPTPEEGRPRRQAPGRALWSATYWTAAVFMASTFLSGQGLPFSYPRSQHLPATKLKAAGVVLAAFYALQIVPTALALRKAVKVSTLEALFASLAIVRLAWLLALWYVIPQNALVEAHITFTTTTMLPAFLQPWLVGSAHINPGNLPWVSGLQDGWVSIAGFLTTVFRSLLICIVNVLSCAALLGFLWLVLKAACWLLVKMLWDPGDSGPFNRKDQDDNFALVMLTSTPGHSPFGTGMPETPSDASSGLDVTPTDGPDMSDMSGVLGVLESPPMDVVGPDVGGFLF